MPPYVVAWPPMVEAVLLLLIRLVPPYAMVKVPWRKPSPLLLVIVDMARTVRAAVSKRHGGSVLALLGEAPYAMVNSCFDR